MSTKIGIVNYGIAGNIHSIKKAVEASGGIPVIIDALKQFEEVEKVILPGVGSFRDAMQELKDDGFISALQQLEKPILGICLGMQILSTLGYEYGQTSGLGLIDAEVKPILVDAKVPHVGFNNIRVIHPNPLLEGLENEAFYFMHSYEVVNYTDIAALTEYAGHQIVSAVQKDNIYGVQFHPEKSREAGIKLFKNFIDL
jgi:imidazole glycerol phosphate synthase glutamine amidotransferase subunit